MITIDEIKRINESKGFHFFDKNTLNFFDSIIFKDVYDTDQVGVYLFITREKTGFESKTHAYTVRKFDEETGNISKCSEFLAFDTLKDARHAASKKRYIMRNTDNFSDNVNV